MLAPLHAFGSVLISKYPIVDGARNTVLISIVFALLIGVAVGWGAIDGWLRKVDSFRNWFIAGLIAGPLAGLLDVIGRSAFVDQTGVADLPGALTSGAAFTALLIIVPAGLGLLVGLTIEPPHRHSATATEQGTSRRRMGIASRRPTGKAPVLTPAKPSATPRRTPPEHASPKRDARVNPKPARVDRKPSSDR